MGSWRKAGVWLGLVEDDDERRYQDRHSDDFNIDVTDSANDDFDTEPVTSTHTRRVRPVTRVGRVSSHATPGSARVSSTPTRDNLALAPQPIHLESYTPEPERHYRIITLHPTTYNEARTIGEHFRDAVPVILNLTEMDESDAKRLVDFAAGLTFGLHGSIERVTNRVFLLSPANVSVTAEDKAKIAEGGFFNQS